MPRQPSKQGAQHFTLTRTRSAREGLKLVPPKLKASVAKVIQRLAMEGCRAAGYALSGDEPWPHICSVHVDGLRIIVVFPSDTEVVVVKVAAHNDQSDPYRELAAELGVPVSTGPRTKPPCCGPDGEPPVDQNLVALIEAAFTRVTERRPAVHKDEG